MVMCGAHCIMGLVQKLLGLSNECSVGKHAWLRRDFGEAGRLSGQGKDSESAEVTVDMLELLK